MKLSDHKRINQCDCNTTLELVEEVELILGDNDEMLQVMSKWSCPKCDNIIEEMTITEKQNILKYPFAKLWNNLWIDDEEKKTKYQKEFKNSEKFFNQLREGLEINGENVNLTKLIYV